VVVHGTLSAASSWRKYVRVFKTARFVNRELLRSRAFQSAKPDKILPTLLKTYGCQLI
jgi:hypothetical protein